MRRLLLSATLVLAGPALADEVRLKSGGVLQGEILEDTPEGITLKSALGTVRIDRRRVASVRKGKYVPPPPRQPEPAETPPTAGPRDPETAHQDEEAREALRSRLRDAMAAFRSFDHEPGAAEAAKGLVAIGPPVVPLVAEVLPDASPFQQKWLAVILGEIRDPAGGKAVLTLLRSPKGEVRGTAASVLALLKDPEAAGVLVRLLDDDDWSVRLAAARGLGTLEAGEAVGALIERLSDSNLLVRGAAHDALVNLTGEKLPARPEDWKAWLKEHAAPPEPSAGKGSP